MIRIRAEVIQDNSSLLLERGLPSLANKYGIPLDSFWDLGFDVTADDGSTDYYKKPFDSAVENQAKAGERLNFAYLSKPFRLSPKDIPVITYSAPIILEDGSVVGVFGLEMGIGRIEQVLSADRTESSFEVCYALGVRQAGENIITPVASSGYLYNQYFKGDEYLEYTDNEEEGIGELRSSDRAGWYASVKQLDVYNYNTPFEQEEWVLVGMARKNDLLSFYNSIRGMLLSSILIPIILSVFGVFVIGKIVTDPIRGLVNEVRKRSGEHGLTLTRVHIGEIDELTETIEQLSADVERSASKISSILEHANVLIGVFEYEETNESVFCSRSIFEMMGWAEPEEPYCYMSSGEFQKRMEEAIRNTKKDGVNYLFHINVSPASDDTGEAGVSGGPAAFSRGRWVRLILDKQEPGTILGVLSDVTSDVEEKEKLERERNYDLLTNLYNRRAFREQLVVAMADGGIQTAAVAMWDLDNLKYINDTYGHDEGDRYIVLFASCLKRLEKDGAIVSRYSGDEFVTLIYGSGGKEEIRHRVTGFMQFLQTVSLEMKGGYQIPIRVSGGMAWYPDDAVDFDTLLNYADFAMYMVKHSVKGIIMEFDSNDYSNNSYMLAGREELNRMLETREVDFAFQPITRRDGSVFGYELLMRPNFTNLKGIKEVLNLARAQAKLTQMETLTWYAGLKAVEKQDQAGALGQTERLFINSIASACMSKEEEADLWNRYGRYLSRVVTELTEGEPVNQEYMRQKIAVTKAWNGLIAIDDFGAGYNSETVLLDMEPDIIKVDMSLVQRIHEDPYRQLILNNILDFAAQNHITVLAEGVETKEELEFLIQCGVELFQGYYIGRPQMEIRPIDPYIVRKMQEFAEKSDFSQK
ncbi:MULTISPECIES: bifunctional diguanylate cyclase/phosphodiesterase [Hungatella]|uniref:bifunctional diguanylate cyclase/phosphodiesterase n=1 Tax=Hungatella TaxID=1649459 RepID=UPI001FA9A5B8|nr:EAL domain-containing protein [Hungatella hathewayi]